MKNPEKRRRVMQRSMLLGHCICDPKKPCPCDVLRQQDICPCAGESLPPPTGPVRLTELVESAGCASKIDQATLQRILHDLPVLDDPKVLVGMPAGDDAGVYLLDDNTALVQTVDVFSPSVDDPYTFGQIAAANSVSDVYAMGGRPITALSIIGFPAGKLPDEIMRRILQGGMDKMKEAGVAVIGGHSIKDNEIKAGFAVTGLIDRHRVATNATAQPGDRLVLTKPIGLGIIAFAAQIGRATPESITAATRAMTTLNRRAAELMFEFNAHACTDVTGFGLMGHLKSMAAASRVDIELIWDDVPLLPNVMEYAVQGILPGAIERNKESSADALVAVDGVEPAMVDILFDAQTSGGLMITLPESSAEAFCSRLRSEGIVEASIIGRVMAEGQGRIMLRSEGRRKTPAIPEKPSVAKQQFFDDTKSTDSFSLRENNNMSCCGGNKNSNAEGPGTAEIQERFQAFLSVANAPGALDARIKRAVAIALSVHAKCGPCLKYHIHKAQDEGFSSEEIDEAAWMAIAFGGSPTMMFYNEAKRQ